jgi:hypothetical protein
MKKVFKSITTWIKSFFIFKEIKKETISNEELTQREKKEIVSNYNQKVWNHFTQSFETPINETKNVSASIEEITSSFEKNITTTDDLNLVCKAHKEILNVTVRSEKPKFNNKPEFSITSNNQKFQITQKQLFFVNTMAELQDAKYGVEMKTICQKFMLMKFGPESYEQLPKHVLLPKYHKKTINHLVKIGVILRLNKTHYLFVV